VFGDAALDLNPAQILVDPRYDTFVFPVCNIGHGPALIKHIAVTHHGVDET
jgi:hypothetical protein